MPRSAIRGERGMREGIRVEVKAADRACLEAIVADRNSPQKHVCGRGSCC